MKSARAIISITAACLISTAASAANLRQAGGSRSFNVSRSINANGTRSFNASGMNTFNSAGVAAFGGNFAAINSSLASLNTTVSPANSFLLSSGLYRLSGLNNGAFNYLPNGQISNFPIGQTNAGLSAFTGPATLSGPYGSGLNAAIANATGAFGPNVPGSASFGSGMIGAGGFGFGDFSAGAVVPGSIDGGGDSNGGPPETPASTVLKGEAALESAAGNYNLGTSLGAVKATEAQSKALDNHEQWVKTYYAMRETGRLARAKERGAVPTAEEFAQRAHNAAPREMNTNQIDPVSGELHWPSFLQDPQYGEARSAVDEVAINWVRYGQLSNRDKERVRENVAMLFTELKSHAGDLPPHEYVACRSFLESFLYATTQSQL